MYRLLLCLLLFVNCGLLAQQNHFIYIQAESRQPFYVKLDKKIYSSTATGYLIVPKLTDGTYNFQLGFAKGDVPEQNLNCTIDKRDAGYLLKNFGDKGWGLFDLQSLNITMAETKSSKKDIVKKEDKNDAFSNMLSDVVNDPSIRQKEVTEEAPKETAPVKENKKAEEPAKVAEQPQPEPVAKIEEPVVTRSIIKREMISKNKEGTEMIYIDIQEDRRDTIRIFIPVDKPAVKEEVAKKEDETKQQEIKEEEAVKKEAKFIDMDMSASTPIEPAVAKKEEKKKKAKADKSTVKVTDVTDSQAAAATTPVAENTATTQTTSTEPANINCKGYATEEDFLKLRKKMAAGDNDDDMINTARKAFKAKCFTTDQIKNLSVLFLADEGKYKFFDAAYSFIADPKNFGTLQTQLTDDYYKNRFKVMIRN